MSQNEKTNQESIKYFHDALVDTIQRSGLSMKIVVPAVMSLSINLLVGATNESDEKIIEKVKSALKQSRENAALLEKANETKQ